MSITKWVADMSQKSGLFGCTGTFEDPIPVKYIPQSGTQKWIFLVANDPAKLCVTLNPFAALVGIDDQWFISPASHILKQDSPWIHLPVKKPICVVQHVVDGGSGVVHLRHSYDGERSSASFEVPDL